MDFFCKFLKNMIHYESFKNVFEVNESILEARKLIAIQKRFKWNKSYANSLRKTQVMSKNEGSSKTCPRVELQK